MLSCAFFGKAIQEHRPIAAAERQQHPVAAGPSLPGTCDPLLDDAAAEIGVDQAAFGAKRCVAQAAVGYPLPAGETGQPFGFVDPHEAVLARGIIAL